VTEGGGPVIVELTLDKGGSSGSLKSVDIPLITSNLYRVEILIPPGCSQLVNVGIFRAESKLFPLNPDGWFNGDGEIIAFPTDLNVSGSDHWTLRGYNEDEGYNHTITTRLYLRRIKWEDLEDLTRKLILVNEDLRDALEAFVDMWKRVPEPEPAEESDNIKGEETSSSS
jgi:hypothetical protein